MNEEEDQSEVAAGLLTILQDTQDITDWQSQILQLLPAQRAELVAPIGNLLNHANPLVRQRAITALKAIGNSTAIALLGQALETDADADVRRTALAALEKVNLIEATPHLRQALNDADALVQESAAYALGTAVEEIVKEIDSDDLVRKGRAQAVLATIGYEWLGKTLHEHERSESRRAAATALGELGGEAAIPYLRRALDVTVKQEVPGVLFNVITALRKIGVAAVPVLGERLIHDANAEIRRQAANALAQLNHLDAIPFLCHALVREKSEDVLQTIRQALVRIPEWERKAGPLVLALEQSQHERATIEAARIIQAIEPPAQLLIGNRHLLTDYLIEAALPYEKEPRMTAVLAALIIASAQGSMSLAGDRINAYQQKHAISENRLRPLRIEIGGATALTPILEVLQQNLEKNFQEPVSRLNTATEQMWATTIWYAQIGFIARTAMSIVVFIVGMILVFASFVLLLQAEGKQTLLFGAGVSFVSGLGSMLTMVYYGPLREIRRSVSDLGIASAAFIAYIHRVLEISHTFSFYYLDQRMSYDEMSKSSKLIDEAMSATIRMLNDTAETSPTPTNTPEPIAANGKINPAIAPDLARDRPPAGPIA